MQGLRLQGGTYEGEWAAGERSGIGIRTFRDGRVSAGKPLSPEAAPACPCCTCWWSLVLQGQLLPAVVPSGVGCRLPPVEAQTILLLTGMQASGRRAPWPISWRSHAVQLCLRVQSR